MKILIINPPRVKGFPVVREERFEHKDIGSVYPPLSLLYGASLLETEGHEVELVDANGFDLSLLDIKQKIKFFNPDAVIIRIGFDTQTEDLKVLQLAKKLGNPITIVRNHIISKVPKIRKQLILENKCLDVFLNQEIESVIVPLIKAIGDKRCLQKVKGISYRIGKKIIDNSDAKLVTDLDKLPYPAYHLLPSLKVYYSGTFGPPFVTILGSRGCPFECAFCAYGKSLYRFRSPKSIADEIDWLVKKYKIHDFCFLDDVVTIDPKIMIEVCKAIIKKKIEIRWSCGIRASTVTHQMLQFMKRAGCDEIAIGVESGSEKILKIIDKRVTIDQIKNAAKICKELKVKLYAMFIIGLPGETRETVLESIKLAKELKSFYTQFCFATPFPDTKVYEYYKKNNLLLSEDWSKYFPLNTEPVIRTKDLLKVELMELKNRAYKETLFDMKYLTSQVRLTDWRWNIKGLQELGKRMIAAINSQPVR